MKKDYCESCGVEWINHLGLQTACDRYLEWKYIATELAQVLYKSDRTEDDIEKVLGEYEKRKFLKGL